MKSISTEFSIQTPAKPIPFCKDVCPNYFSSNTGSGEIIKKNYNTRALRIQGYNELWSLALKNCGITYWADLWWDNNTQLTVDPKIAALNLSGNQLTEFTVEEERSKLVVLDLSLNERLEKVYLPISPKLKAVKLNGIQGDGLAEANVGRNSLGLERLEMRQSFIRAGVLSSFVFRVVEGGVLDLRGAEIEFNEEDSEVLDFLLSETSGWRVFQ